MAYYDRRSLTGQPSHNIPRYVESSEKEGWRITHKCLFAWSPQPSPSHHYQIRSLFMVLDTVFTLTLWAMKSRDKDYFMPNLCPWPRDSLPYDGCCSHSSIKEPIVGQNEEVTSEEINRVAAEKKRIADEKKAIQRRIYNAKGGAKVHKAHEKG